MILNALLGIGAAVSIYVVVRLAIWVGGMF